MIKTIHPIAGAIAFFIIATFWLATLWADLLGTDAQIVAVKTAIPWGMLLLVPAMAAAGASGFKRAKGRRGGVLGAKARRMQVIAVNGIVVLIPSALFLASKAHAADFDTAFYAVQVVELTAGAVNLALLSMSMQDGLRLARRLKTLKFPTNVPVLRLFSAAVPIRQPRPFMPTPTSNQRGSASCTEFRTKNR